MDEYTITWAGAPSIWDGKLTAPVTSVVTVTGMTLHTPEQRLRAVETELDALGALAELMAQRLDKLAALVAVVDEANSHVDRRVEHLEARLALAEATDARLARLEAHHHIGRHG